MSQIIKVPFNGHLIGQGYNSQTGENIGTALTVGSVFEDQSADGQGGATSFDMVTTQEDLLEKLDISTSGDVQFGFFSGGEKSDFAEQHAVNSCSTFIVGRSFVQNAIRHGQGFALTSDAKALISAERLSEFKQAFGDRFVRSLYTGGEICVIARVTSVSTEHQTKLSASLNAAYNGLVDSAHFSADFNSAMQETDNRTEVTVALYQCGGQGGQLSFTGPDAASILQRLKDFPATVHEHAVGLVAELASYDTIPLPIPTAEQQEDRQLVLQDCAKQKSALLSTIADIDLALEPHDPPIFANLPDRNTLVAIQGQYRSTLSALIAHAVRVSTGQMDPPQVFVANPIPPAISFPKVPFSTKKVTPFVGTWKSDNDPVVKQLTIIRGSDDTQASVADINGISGNTNVRTDNMSLDAQGDLQLQLTIPMYPLAVSWWLSLHSLDAVTLTVVAKTKIDGPPVMNPQLKTTTCILRRVS